MSDWFGVQAQKRLADLEAKLQAKEQELSQAKEHIAELEQKLEESDQIKINTVHEINSYLMKNGYSYFPFKTTIGRVSTFLADYMKTIQPPQEQEQE